MPVNKRAASTRSRSARQSSAVGKGKRVSKAKLLRRAEFDKDTLDIVVGFIQLADSAAKEKKVKRVKTRLSKH